jgi:hypothetical protein
MIIPLGPFRISSKIPGDIRSSRSTGGKLKKIFNQKSVHYFFWTPSGSRVSIWINFFLQKPAELVAKFAAGVVDTGSN